MRVSRRNIRDPSEHLDLNIVVVGRTCARKSSHSIVLFGCLNPRACVLDDNVYAPPLEYAWFAWLLSESVESVACLRCRREILANDK